MKSCANLGQMHEDEEEEGEPVEVPFSTSGCARLLGMSCRPAASISMHIYVSDSALVF